MMEDGFDYLNGKEFWDIYKVSFAATVKAHREKLPCLILEVNPFDQPRVEAYKKWMFEALGKDRKIS